MIKKLFFLFVFFAPFTSFFAISAWLRIPVILNQILFLIVLIGLLKFGKLKNKWFNKEDLFLLGFLFVVWVSFLFGFLEKKSFNHSLAYTNSILFFFFLSKYVIKSQNITSLSISKVSYYSFLTVSFIIIIDFIGVNYFNLEIRTLYSEIDYAISNTDYFIRSGFKRVGGVAEEPGHMAFFYNIYFCISLFYIHQLNSYRKNIFIFLIFLLCHFAMFSNAGIILPILAGIIIFLINKLKKLKISRKQISIILIFFSLFTVAFIVFLFFDIGNISNYFEAFFDKILFNEGDKSYSSSGQRLKQWQRAFLNFIQKPVLGNGPGFGVNEDPEGYLSVYLTILSDIGILGLLLFLSFLNVIIQRVMKLELIPRSFLLFGVIVSFLHLTIIADFYHAPFWILLFFIQLIYKERKVNLL